MKALRQYAAMVPAVFVGIVAIALVMTAADRPARAQGGATACFVSQAKLADEDIAAFLADPGKLLTEHPAGGLTLANHVRALAGSDSRTLDALIGLNETATAAQRAAIGAGLARAAVACAPTQPEYAALIQEKVAAVGEGELFAAFEAAFGDTQTSEIAGGVTSLGGLTGGGGAGPSGPSGGSGGTGSSGSDSFSTGGAGSFSLSSPPPDVSGTTF